MFLWLQIKWEVQNNFILGICRYFSTSFLKIKCILQTFQVFRTEIAEFSMPDSRLLSLLTPRYSTLTVVSEPALMPYYYWKFARYSDFLSAFPMSALCVQTPIRVHTTSVIIFLWAPLGVDYFPNFACFWWVQVRYFFSVSKWDGIDNVSQNVLG